MDIKTIYIVYYIESNGHKYIEAITDNPKEWIKVHNTGREFGEHESLDDFTIVRKMFQKFEK